MRRRAVFFIGLLTLACGVRQDVAGLSETGESGEGESGTGASGTGTGTGSGTETGPGACIPGQSIPCACPGGGDGAQVCENDGMSFGPCDCGAAETGDTTDTGTDTGEATDTGDPGDCLPADEPWPGNYMIGAPGDIAEIAPYSVISGSLQVMGDGVVDLQGMGCLRRIGNQLVVYETTLLQDLTGLDNLATVQGEIEIGSNTGLTSLAGAPVLATAGWFSVYENLNLSSVDEFPALQSVSGGFGVDDNVALPTCNAVSLADKLDIGGMICITGNKADACADDCG